MPAFSCGFEAPGANRFDGLFIQTHAERACNLNVARQAIGVDHQLQHHRPLVLGFASFFRKLGVRIVDRPRSADPAAYAEDTTADAAATSRTQPVALPRPDAPTGTGT